MRENDVRRWLKNFTYWISRVIIRCYPINWVDKKKIKKTTPLHISCILRSLRPINTFQRLCFLVFRFMVSDCSIFLKPSHNLVYPRDKVITACDIKSSVHLFDWFDELHSPICSFLSDAIHKVSIKLSFWFAPFLDYTTHRLSLSFLSVWASL